MRTLLASSTALTATNQRVKSLWSRLALLIFHLLSIHKVWTCFWVAWCFEFVDLWMCGRELPCLTNHQHLINVTKHDYFAANDDGLESCKLAQDFHYCHDHGLDSSKSSNTFSFPGGKAMKRQIIHQLTSIDRMSLLYPICWIDGCHSLNAVETQQVCPRGGHWCKQVRSKSHSFKCSMTKGGIQPTIIIHSVFQEVKPWKFWEFTTQCQLIACLFSIKHDDSMLAPFWKQQKQNRLCPRREQRWKQVRGKHNWNSATVGNRWRLELQRGNKRKSK